MAFPSVYEMFTPLTTVRKQHFWDYFSGATLNSRWTERNGLSGDGTVSTSYAVMADEVNGGVKISSNTGTWGKTALSFNGKRPFDATASRSCSVSMRAKLNAFRSPNSGSLRFTRVGNRSIFTPQTKGGGCRL